MAEKAATTSLARKLFKSTSTVASMTMLSRILGFIRDIVLAQTFGASPGFDAFLIAFKIPNFLRRLFAEGAFSQAFVPVLAEYREQHGDKVQTFMSHIAGCLALTILLVVIVAEIIAPLLVLVFAPGFWHDPLRYTLASSMLRITFPYILLISLTALSGAILNTYNRFAIPAFTPVLLNVALIGVAVLWAPHSANPIITLAWGVVLGGVWQLSLQLPALLKAGIMPRLRPNWKDPGVRKVLKLMVPALFGVSIAQLSLLIDSLFASFLPVGSISWLYYSDRLTFLPLGVVGVALATVVLPQLSKQFARGSEQSYSATVEWGVRMALIVGLPAAIGIFMLAGPILATLIHRGQFTSHDVIMTAKSLRAYAFGLPFFMLIKVLASGFYSRQQIRTPVKVAAAALVVNMTLNFLLIRYMAHAGLALATAVAAAVNASLLFFLLAKHQYYKAQTPWWPILSRLVLATVVMVGFLYWLTADVQVWLLWTGLQRAWHLTTLILLSMALYFITLIVSGLRMQHLKPPVQ